MSEHMANRTRKRRRGNIAWWLTTTESSRTFCDCLVDHHCRSVRRPGANLRRGTFWDEAGRSLSFERAAAIRNLSPTRWRNIQKLIAACRVFGICLGHQLCGLALGGKTFKLKFGHHGSNHPVKNLLTEQVGDHRAKSRVLASIRITAIQQS